MKVMHLISGGDSGGAKTHVHLLLKHLNRDMTATLVCFMRGPFSEEAAALGIPTVVIEKPLPAALAAVKKLVTEGGYDLLHCHGSRGNLMGALLKPLCGVPVLTTVHSDPKIDYLGRPLAGAVYGTLNAFALRRMDYYIGVSDAMREKLISRGFRPNRIFSIYNGLEFDAAPGRSESSRAAFFQRVGLSAAADSVVVGIAARLHPVKDVATLLRGFALAYAQNPKLRLLIAGDGQERETLASLATSLGIADVTCFAGWVDDMPAFYRAIDINTLTSRSETFPYAITEGAQAYLPTVSTRVGGVPKLVRHGETGLLFEPGDAAALGAALAALAADPAERERLGRALHDKAAAEFSVEATCRTQEHIYERVLRDRDDRLHHRRRGAVICGAYGMSNAGDEAILEAVVAELRSIDPEMPLTVITRAARETALKLGTDTVFTFDLPRFSAALRRAKLYVNGGGSLIQDVTSTRSLLYYLYTLSLARRRGCRVMMYGCGIGPVKKRANRRLAGSVIEKNVDAITLREENSLAELRDMGVHTPSIAVASDPALFLPPAGEPELDALWQRLGLEKDRCYFCLCVRRWHGMQEKLPIFAAAARHAREKFGLTPLLLSVNRQQDDQLAARLREMIGGDCALVTGELATGETVGLISRMQLMLAMRLHALVFAASQSVPLVGVAYDPKVASFLDYISQTNYIDLTALTAPEQLTALIDAAMDTDRGALRASTARIMEIERRSADTARRLLEEGESK